MTTPITGDGGHLMYQSGIFSGGRLPRRPRPDLGTVEEPARAIPVFRDCDVLVVGGGNAGCAAASNRLMPGHGYKGWRSAAPWNIRWDFNQIDTGHALPDKHLEGRS